MFWPSSQSDLNPIELVWDELDQKVRTKQATSAVYLWHLLQQSWAEQSSVYVQSLVERMQRICEAGIMVKGGNFEESKVQEVFCVNLYLMWLGKTYI